MLQGFEVLASQNSLHTVQAVKALGFDLVGLHDRSHHRGMRG